MRNGGGKQKGSQFEREVCQDLSRWVSHGKANDLFWRSAMSGGRATVRNRTGEKIAVRQAGDITAVAPEGHLLTDRIYFELKFYKDLRWSSFFLTNEGPLAGFWHDTCEQAKRHGRIPALIARQNRMPTMLITLRQMPWPFQSASASIIATEQECDCSVIHFRRLLRTRFPEL